MWERHFADDKEAASDLAYKAAERAIYASNTTRHKDIDMIIVGTISPDHPFPATACIVMQKLGLKDIPAFDISAGCTGFIYALDMAKLYIESGVASNVLVIGVEILSRLINWEDRGTCVLFGDGAGAAIVKRNVGQHISQIIDSKITADASDWELLVQRAGGSRVPASRDSVSTNQHTIYMEGNKIFKRAVNAMSSISAELMKKHGYSLKDIDWVIPHQANLRIIEAVADKLKLGMDKVIVTIDKYANTSASTIPLAMTDAVKENRIKRGDVVLLTAFGAGLTYGSTLLRY
jgi:3-oxoacyl-[acyl-carrier-protein] synthase-3